MEAKVKDYAKYRIRDILFTSISIVTYSFDVVTDVLLAVSYYKNNQFWPAVLTIIIVLTSSIIINICCICWFIKDNHLKRSTPIYVWAIHIVLIILQCGPMLNYVYLIYYATLSIRAVSVIKKKFYISLATYYDHDSSLLRIFETYIESLPQLILQIYIFFKCDKCHHFTFFHIDLVYLQIISIGSSWISIAWSITSYYRILRFSNLFKINVTIKASIVYFLWKFFSTGGRTIILALFSLHHAKTLFLLLAAHWFCMTIWIIYQKSTFCSGGVIANGPPPFQNSNRKTSSETITEPKDKSHKTLENVTPLPKEEKPKGLFWDRISEYMYDALIGLVYIFSYMNVVDGKTRFKLTAFYGVMLIENCTMLTLWYMRATTLSLYVRLGIIMFCLVAFCFDIFFLTLYYMFYHPLRMCNSIAGTGEIQTPLTSLNGNQEKFNGQTLTIGGPNHCHSHLQAPANSIYPLVDDQAHCCIRDVKVPNLMNTHSP